MSVIKEVILMGLIIIAVLILAGFTISVAEQQIIKDCNEAHGLGNWYILNNSAMCENSTKCVPCTEYKTVEAYDFLLISNLHNAS